MIPIHALLEGIELCYVNEILDGTSKPFPWQNAFYDISNKGHMTTFLAPKEDKECIPEITVTFAKFYVKNKLGYEMGFSVDGDDIQSFKSDLKYGLRILSTILIIIQKFIILYTPEIIRVSGIDKLDVNIPGQKNRIYFSLIEKHAPTWGYNYGHSQDSITLIKK